MTIEPGTIAVSRRDANRYLRIVRIRLSYDILPPVRELRARVRVSDIVRVLNGFAVNGAFADAADLPELLTVPEVARLCSATPKEIYAAMRPRKRGGLPNFRITRRTALTTEAFARKWMSGF